MRLGVDVDGVLADFNANFIELIIQVTGRDLFPPRPFDIPVWEYPAHYGYTETEQKAVWDNIAEDPFFWEKLPGYEDTAEVLYCLQQQIVMNYWEVYFITSRPGKWPKIQTEHWLRGKNSLNMTMRDEFKPTVLVSADKGHCANALKLDAYIDDKWDNCLDVWNASLQTHVYMLERSWNTGWRLDAIRKGISPVKKVEDMLAVLR